MYIYIFIFVAILFDLSLFLYKTKQIHSILREQNHFLFSSVFSEVAESMDISVLIRSTIHPFHSDYPSFENNVKVFSAKSRNIVTMAALWQLMNKHSDPLSSKRMSIIFLPRAKSLFFYFSHTLTTQWVFFVCHSLHMTWSVWSMPNKVKQCLNKTLTFATVLRRHCFMKMTALKEYFQGFFCPQILHFSFHELFPLNH